MHKVHILVDLEKEATVAISSVTRLTNFRSSIPVVVKIGSEHMQVITVSHYNHLIVQVILTIFVGEEARNSV